MANYPVFTSYAQADREKHLEKFVAEFRKGLRALSGGTSDAALAFFDRDGVQAGDKWTPVILDAVNHADVLLCLMSPTYLGREWCGRELEIFLQRYKHLPVAAHHARFIFPIWWQLPGVPRPLPRRLSEFHYRDIGYPEHYETLGVRGLARRSFWAQFRQMADRLAQLISETLAAPHRLPPGQDVDDILTIQNAFDEQQPYDVKLVALTTGGDAWRPAATEPSIADVATDVAQRLQLFIRKMQTGPHFLVQLERAQAEQQVIVLIVDAAVPNDANLAAINNLALPNLSVLLVDAASPTVGADNWLARLNIGAFANAKESGLMRVAGPGELSREFERLVDQARRRLQTTAPVTKAEDSGLAENARAQGITTNVQPHLTGPG